MKSFISYLIEANLGICFFIILYQWILKKETDHRFNRSYLLFSLSLALAVPFFHFQWPSLLTVDKVLQTYWLPEIEIGAIGKDTDFQFDSFWFWVSLIYILGAALFSLVFIIRLLKISRAIYQSPRVKNGPFWVIELDGDCEVFSFFNFIFIGKSLHLTEGEKNQIIRHEQVHIHHHHSVDILAVNLVGILFWFNPFLKEYRKSLVQLHEFEADARSVDNHEVDAYCCLLAKAALESSGYPLANHFTNSLTLKRIEMMKTVKTKIAKWKIVTIAGTAFVFCCLMAGNGLVLAQADPKSNASTDEVFEVVDEIPTFGQANDLWNFIAKNLKYPEEAMKKGIEGKVFTKFVVEKDGTVTNVSVMRGIGYGCDEAAARVIKLLPPWNPGKKEGKNVRTSFVIPISFQLSEPKKGG